MLFHNAYLNETRVSRELDADLSILLLLADEWWRRPRSYWLDYRNSRKSAFLRSLKELELS